MKKLIVLLLLPVLSYGQVIKHHSYTVYFNPAVKCADSVVWDLTPAMVNCSKTVRVNKFAADPLLPNSPKPSDFKQVYKDKAHELAKGHLFSYEDAIASPIDRKECFYMTNMYRQFQNFNAGDWKSVEQYERQLAAKGTIHVIAGYIGVLETLLNGGIIPQYMYKAIWDGSQWEVWIMPNDPSSEGHDIDHWRSTVEELDKQTGLKL